MEEEQVRAIKIIVFGVISWGLAFILTRRIFSSYSFSFSNRLLSTAHATIAVTLATLSVQDLSCPVCPLASKPSPKQVLLNHIITSTSVLNLYIITLFGHCNQTLIKNTKQMDVMAFSLSYMIYDLICCHFDKVFSIDNAVHHFVSILGFIAGLAYQKVFLLLFSLN